MDINIVTTFENTKDFLSSAKQETADIQHLWQRYMIEPYWDAIAKWAPFDQSFKKPPCVKELSALEEQLPILSKIHIDDLKEKFLDVVKAVPPEDDNDESMSVFLYPASNSENSLKERQNGVVGTVVFGNIIIRINPLANDFEKWIPFVFAHEYHHNIWGYNQFVLRGGKDTDGSFLEYMITEGQADLFAESLFPELIPQWNRPFDGEREKTLWNRIKPVLASADSKTHSLFMFGDETEDLPWCMGYSFGRMIVADYMDKHVGLSFSSLIDIPAKQIFKETKFYRDIKVV